MRHAYGNRLHSTMLLAVLMVLLPGCATVNTAPFSAYAKNVGEVQASVDSAMLAGEQWVRRGFVNAYDGPLSSLMVQPGLDYDWSMETVPQYIRIRQARQTLWQLNQAMLDYARLLVQLADHGFSSGESFQAMARQLNDNTAAAAAAWQQPVSPEQTALFSTAAIGLAQQYIRSQSIGELGRALSQNQALAEHYSEHCIRLVRLLRESVKVYYGDHVEPIRREWPRASQDGRGPAVAKMLDLNDQLLATLQLLQQVEGIYRSLPQAHKDLVKSLQAAVPAVDGPGLKRLAGEMQRLQKLYRELKPE